MPPKKKKEQEKAPVDESFQALDISTREPRTVLLMLASPEPAVVVKALQALNQHMQKSEQNCKEIAGLGVVPSLVGLLSSPVKAVRSYTALSLSIMTTSAEVRREVCKSEVGLPSLLQLLKPEEEAVTVEYATAVLAHMTTEYSTKMTLNSLKVHQSLLPLIVVETEPNTQKFALTALRQLVELHNARCPIAEDGGMTSLLSLLSSEYPIIQELALHTLISCTHDIECRVKLREASGLDTLVSFLGNKEVSGLHLLAATTLSLCLHDADNMTALQSSGALDHLLSHITDPAANIDMMRCSTQALARAARDEMNRKILHEQNIEKTFIQLLTNTDVGVVCAALDGLGAMCTLNSGRARVGQEGGVRGVITCAGREADGAIMATAAQCLAHITTESPANSKLVHEAEGCSLLVKLLCDSHAMCRSGAAATITNIATSPLTRDELMNAEVIPALVECLKFTEVTVQKSAAEALAVMATDSTARIKFLSSGGVASTIPLLLSTNQSLVNSALCLVHSSAHSTEVAQEFCGKGALELLTQLSQKSNSPSSVGAALQQLLNFDLSAKWWTEGHLTTSDIIIDIEFFDAGPASSKSHQYISLPSLLSTPLYMNRPILTANLLIPSGTTPTSNETTPIPAATTEPSPSQSRSKSRLNAKSRKGREVESRISDSSRTQEAEEQIQSVQSDCSKGVGKGVLPPDPGLQSHITHTLTHITPLPTLTQQAIALASYVCNSMGGPMIASGNVPYDLHQSQLQKGAESNVVAIGNVTMGTYQHRSLLFKVLADQIGLPCTLTRGDYGRHWNEVTIATDNLHSYVVDLMTSGGGLMESGSPQAQQYCHIV